MKGKGKRRVKNGVIGTKRNYVYDRKSRMYNIQRRYSFIKYICSRGYLYRYINEKKICRKKKTTDKYNHSVYEKVVLNGGEEVCLLIYIGEKYAWERKTTKRK